MTDPASPAGAIPVAGLHPAHHGISGFQAVIGFLRHRLDFGYACWRAQSADGAWLSLQEEHAPGRKTHRGQALPTEGSANGAAIRGGRPVVSTDLRQKPAFHEDIPDAAAGFRCRVCVPITFRDRPLGALELLSEKENAFTAVAVEPLGWMSELIGFAVTCDQATREAQELQKRLEKEGLAARPDAGLHSTLRAHIVRALESCRGRIYGEKGAARLLGLKPSTLQAKVKRLGIDPKNLGAAPRPVPTKSRRKASPSPPPKSSAKKKASAKPTPLPSSPPPPPAQKVFPPPRFVAGARVQFKKGLSFPDHPELYVGGWTGNVLQVKWVRERWDCFVEFDAAWAARFPADFLARRKQEGRRCDGFWIPEGELDPVPAAGPTAAEEQREERIRTALGLKSGADIPTPTLAALRTYYRYLVARLAVPFDAHYTEVGGAEDGRTFSIRVNTLLAPQAGGEKKGFLVDGRRGDGKSGWVPLGWVELPKTSPSWQLLDDYSEWFYTWL